MCLLDALPADYVKQLSSLKTQLEEKETELDKCKKFSKAKADETGALQRQLSGMWMLVLECFILHWVHNHLLPKYHSELRVQVKVKRQQNILKTTFVH